MRRLFYILAIIALVSGFLFTGKATAQQPIDPGKGSGGDSIFGLSPQTRQAAGKSIDQPNVKDYQRNQYRMTQARSGDAALASSLALTGKDNVLVLLVEFAGTDTFTWQKGVSTWDPLGKADPNEDTGVLGDCSKIITETKSFTYSGPMHNQIPTPVSQADASGNTIWAPDFSPDWFTKFMFGNGVQIQYNRVDGSTVSENFLGKSVRDFYNDLSNGAYDIEGKVVGWLQMPHSTWYYDADQCPGARSTSVSGVRRGGLIPGAGDARNLVKDALDAVNAKVIAGELPGFNWKDYDQNGDGVIDRLWIVHAGYGEEDNTTLMNRTNYGEAAVWSHSSAVTPSYVVDPVNHISAGPYIVMPENGGIGVFAHEYGHNLGAADLYAYGEGETSAGFWTTMADDWTGYPLGFEPPAPDPMHLDWWGWLNPTVVNDPTKTYDVTIGQASRFPGNTTADAKSPDGMNMVRGVRIDLPKGVAPQAVPVWAGSNYWWGGKGDVMNSMMTLNTSAAIHVPASPATTALSFDLVYDIEDGWDFMWVQASKDDGATWTTLTNANTKCVHDPSWIGGLYNFPDDLCTAGISGFTGYNANWPDPQAQTFNLSTFAGQTVRLRFWYMTDWGTTYSGPYLDNIKVSSGATDLLSDNAETVNQNWTYAPKWERNNGFLTFDQSFYLQWRNTNVNGGYDAGLGDPRFRFGPANTGLLVWYNNTFYTDNEVFNYLQDYPSFGPKGMMLVVDSHSDPYRYPSKVTSYPNEGANLTSRMLMRDAPFTLSPTVDFNYLDAGESILFPGQTAATVFHDSLGYYPGAEFIKRSPAQTSRWVTKQWDSSVVMPSSQEYALNAPGYIGTGGTTNQEMRYDCSINSAGLLGCYYTGAGVGLGYNGGNGNPADVDGQYGWHVELVQEAADHTFGTVRIWNSKYAVDSSVMPAETKVTIHHPTTITASFKNTGSISSYLACAAIDTSMATYVAGSASGTPVLLPACPEGSAPADLNSTTGPVGGLAWLVNDALPGATATFTYQVSPTRAGLVDSGATVISFPPNQQIHTTLTAKSFSVVDLRTFIPYQTVVIP